MVSEVQHGDCLTVGRSLSRESVDLIYVDPAFFHTEDSFVDDSRPRYQVQILR